MKHIPFHIARLFALCLAHLGVVHAEQPPLLASGIEIATSNERTSLVRGTGRLSSTVDVKLTNTSDRLLEAPLHVLITFTPLQGGNLNGLTTTGVQGGIDLAPYQTFYKDLSAVIGEGLQPRAHTSFTFTFERPSTTSASYALAVRGIRNIDPVVSAGGPYSGQQGTPISFDASASTDPDGESLTFAWDFGDGDTATGATPQHTFATSGLFTVVLTATDPRGGIASRETQVSIAPSGVFALGRTRTLDGNGHPLGQVVIGQTGPDGARTYGSDATSGFASLGGQPGEHVWQFSHEGYLTCFRKAALGMGTVRVIPYPWLAALNPQRTTLSLLNATEVRSPENRVALMVPAESYGQVESVALTDLHGQSLPLPLPHGWSPLAAFHFDAPGDSAENISGNAMVAPALSLALVRFDEANVLWRTESVHTGHAGDSLAFVIRKPGSYVVVVADALPTGNPAAAVAGEPLPAGDAPVTSPDVTAVGSVDPTQAVARLDPTRVTALASVDFTNAGQPLASGAWFSAEVSENYDMRDGQALKTPDYDATFYAYQSPGDANPATAGSEFPLRPRILFGPDQLEEAHIQVNILAAGIFSGGILTPEGSRLTLAGLEIGVPAGLVTGPAAAEIRLISTTGLERFSGGIEPVMAFALDLPPLASGAILDFLITRKLAPDSHFVLARLTSAGGETGLAPVLRLKTDGVGTVTHNEPASGARLPGISGSGQYVVVPIAQARALITGTATQGGAPAAGAVIHVVDEPWLSVTDAADGFFSLGLPGERVVIGTDPATGNSGEGAATLADAAAHAVVNLTLLPSGPRVVSSSPADGAVRVAASTPITIQFNKALDRVFFGSEAIVVTNPLGVVVAGSVILSTTGKEARFLPTHPLEHAATYTVKLADTLRDKRGNLIEGDREFSFSVLPFFERPPGAQLVIYEPGADNVPAAVLSMLTGYNNAQGSSHVIAHGSPGTADPDVPVILVNQNSGATATVLSKLDGSFANFIDAAEEDFIEAVFVNSNGTRVTVPATRQIYDNGRIGLYKYGGILEAESDGGPVQVLIEPEAIKERSVFKVDLVTVNQLAELTGGVLPEGGNTALPSLKIEVEGEVPEGDAEVSMPLDPATLGLEPGLVPEAAAFALTVPVEVDGQVVYITLDKMRYENGRLFTNTCPFKGVYSASIPDNVIAFGGNFLPGVASAAAGLGQLVVPILLSKGFDGTTINGSVAQLPMSDLTQIEIAQMAELALLPLQLFGGKLFSALDLLGPGGNLLEEIKTNGAPAVQGALVSLQRENETFDGRVRSGMVCAVSDQNGCYSLVAPVVEGKLVATHPRLGRSREVPLGILDLLDIQTKAFLARNVFFGVQDAVFLNLSPRFVSSHSPLLPAVAEPVTLEVNVFTTAAASVSIRITKKTVSTLVLGQEVSAPDLHLVSGDPVQVAPGHTRRIFTLTADKALLGQLELHAEATTNGQTLTAKSVHSVVFGFSRPTVNNPLTASDPDDREGPHVIGVTPRQGATLYPGEEVRVRFNEPIDRSSLAVPGIVTFSTSLAVPPSLALSADQQTLTIHPRQLPAGGNVTMVIGASVRDLAGNEMSALHSTVFQSGALEAFDIPNIGQGSGSVMDGSLLYVLDRATPGRVRIMDVSNPVLPGLVGEFSALAVASVPGENATNALDFPRDLALIKGWSHVPGLTDGAEQAASERTLLAVVGGTVGSVSIDAQGNDIQNGQYLTLLDVTNPAQPKLVLNVRLTLRPSVVPKIQWRPPYLVYLENSADTHFVNLINLQEMLIGFSVPRLQREQIFATVKRGNDLNGDGDFTDEGEQRPWPNLSEVTEFMGFFQGYDVLPFPAQRIEDFDFSVNALAVVRSVSGLAPPVPVSARPEFRLLRAGSQELPPQAGFVSFEEGARPKRLTLAPLTAMADGGTRNLAFVSLSPDADGVQKLAVIDWTSASTPQLMVKMAFPDELGLGILQSPVMGEDGLLRVSTSNRVIVIDPSRVNAVSDGGLIHPAVLAFLPNGGSSNVNIGVNDAGVRSVAQGGRNQLTLGPPVLGFVQFPTLNTVADPQLMRVDAGAREDALDAMRSVTALIPARYRQASGVPSALSPASPTAHYHVLVNAPGGCGVTLPLLVESLNEAGAALQSQGRDYPPVRAGASVPDLKPGGALVDGVDAPSPPLTAYRLSDDIQDPLYNVYLSDPIVVIREKIQISELETLIAERRRAILWSEVLLRATLDIGVSTPLAVFASEYDALNGAYRPRVSAEASTLPGGYIPGSAPPPVGGELSVPGTFGTIDATNGEFRYSTVDLELPSRRMPILIERIATSHALVGSGFGRGWDFNYNQRAIELKPELIPLGQRVPVTERGGVGKDIVAESLDIILSDGAGNAIVFENKGSTAPAGVDNDPLVDDLGWASAGGEFYLPAAEQKGVFDLMYRYPSGEMVRLTPDGTQFRYRKDGRLSKIEDRYPNNRQLLDYNNDGELRRIRDLSVTDNRSIRWGYFRKTGGGGDFDSDVDRVATSDNHAGKICSLLDFAGRRVDFEYDDAGMLIERFGIEVFGANDGFPGRPRTTYQINPQTRAYVGIIAGSGAHGSEGDSGVGGEGNAAGTPLAVAQTSANTQGESVANASKGASGPVGIQVPANRNAANVSTGTTQTSHADGSSTATSYDGNGYPSSITMGGGGGDATHQTIHNPRGLPETIIYPEGNLITYEYEPDSAPFRARGNVVKITRNPGPRPGPTLISESAYDHRYNLPSGEQKDFNGNTITISLRGDGRDAQSTQYTKAGTYQITRNEFGQATSETSVEGITNEIDYDSSTGYTTNLTVGALTTGYGYNSSIAAKLGVPSSITPLGGAPITQEHDARLQRILLSRGEREELFGYDENGNLVFASKTLGDGALFVEQREYSQINFLRKVTLRGVETAGGSQDLVTTFTPDEVNRVKTMTLPGQEARVFEYDHLGQITKLDIGAYSEQYGRDRQGNLTVLKKGGDVVQEWDYDGHDRPVIIRQKTGTGADEVTSLSYFGTGETHTRTVSGPVGGVVSETVVADVDEIGRPLSVEAKGNQVNTLITNNYTGNGGRTVTAVGPLDTFTSTHDDAGRLVAQSNSLRSVVLTPDANGNVTRVDTLEDGKTYTVNMAYDDLDHLTRTFDSLGTILESTSLRHDGLPLSVSDGRGNIISKSYSRLGELLQIEKPEQLRFSYNYTANRQPAAILDRSNAGNTTAYADGTLRPTSTTWRDGSTTSFNAPDGRNLPTSISIPGGSMTASYDLQGRALSLVTSFTGGGYRLQNVEYDALGRMRSANYGSSGQHSVTYSYDKLGPLTGVAYNEPGGPFPISTTVREDGARLTLDYPSGVTVTETRQDSGRISKVAVDGATLWEVTSFAGADEPATILRGAGITETNEYDARRRLLARRFTAAGDVVLEDLRFQYDGADNLTTRQSLIGGGRADLFTYDAANRLTRAEYGARTSFQGANRITPTGLAGGAGFAPGWMARAYQYDLGGLDLLQSGGLANPDTLPLQTAAPSALAVPQFATTLGNHDSFLFPALVDGFNRGAPDALGSTARAQLLARPASGAPTLVAADLAYNAHTNLVRIQRGDGVLIENQYRPDKLMHHRKVTGGSEPSERALVWFEGRLLEEYDLSSGRTLVARYYYATSDAPIAADLLQSDNSMLRVHYLQDQVMSVVAVASEAGEVLERVRYEAWGQPLLTARDQTPPRVAEVRREGDDLFVVMSEPVLPLLAAPAGIGLVADNPNAPDLAFRLVTGGDEQAPQVVFEENAPGLPFGTVFRLTPAATLSGNVTLRVIPGTLVDAWNNQTVGEDVNFVWGAGPLLATGGVANGATAPVAISRSSIGNPWLWQGQWFDYDAGLSYMRARHYDPNTGSFLQRDPAQYEDSVNLYAGMRHNPVTLRDPTGMSARSVSKAARNADDAVDAAQNSASFARRQGLTDIEHQAITNVLNQMLDKGQEIRLSIRGFGKKAAARRKLAEQGIQAKPSIISDKTGPDAAIRFTDTATGKRRVIASDLDALHLEINGRMASHSESMKLFGEINREVNRLKRQFGKPAWPPFQHGAQTGMVHLYSPTHSKKFTGAVYKLKGVEGGTVGAGELKHGNKFIDDGFMTKVGHPGDSFTFKSSKNGGIEAYPTPRAVTTQDIQTAERILMKHQADHGMHPVGFGESWYKWKE